MKETKSRCPAPNASSGFHSHKYPQQSPARFLISMLVLTLVLVGHIAVAAPTKYVEGEAIVTFKPSVGLAAATQAVSAHSLELAKQFPFLSDKLGRQFGLLRGKNRTTESLLAELSRDPAVETAEPNYLRWVSVHPPNDLLFPHLWALQNKGQSVHNVTGTSGDDVKFVAAW